MRNPFNIIALLVLFMTGIGFGQETLSPERFQEIVKAPGDAVPLRPQLAPIPFWTNAVVSNVMTSASGKVFSEVMPQTAHTVEGKYVVFTTESQFHRQPINAILWYDEKASSLKACGLYSDKNGSNVVTEATVVYDYAKNTYTMTSAYGNGFTEKTFGSYTTKEDDAKTKVYKNGVLFMSREAITRPIPPRN